MRGKTMLLRNVRQILTMRDRDSKESFDRIVTLRKSLNKGIQKVVIEGPGFITWDPEVLEQLKKAADNR